MELPLPLIQLTGTREEIGGALGERTRDAVAESIAWYGKQFRDVGGITDAERRRLGAEFGERTRAWHPPIAEALDALADGAGVDSADVYAINARTEMMSAAPVPPDACTAAAVTGRASADGGLLLGQNWDWGVDVPDTTVLLATRDERGHGVVTLAEPGMLAKTGMNDAGVGLTVNILRSGSDRAEAGIPYHVRLRAALDERGFDDAERAASAGPCAASINIMLAGSDRSGEPGGSAGDHASVDSGGRAVDLEVTPDGVRSISPVDGLLVHTNHCVIAHGGDDVGPVAMPSSEPRHARALELLQPRRGSIDTDALRAVFTDHAGGEDAVCRHAGVDQRRPPGDKTVYSVTMNLTERTFAVARGPVCENPHVERLLTDLLP